MAWIGKILGGGIGMMLGGPLGALLGATLGHSMFDQQAGSPGQISGIEQRNAIFFTAIFAMLGKMAKADGRVCENEIETVHNFMQHRLCLDPAAQQFAIGIFNQAKDDVTPFEDYARQFGQMFAHDPQLRMMFYELLFSVAMADGVLHPAEDHLLRATPAALGMHGDVYQTVRRQFVNNLSHHYAVLGLDEGADKVEVKKAYPQLVIEYHPEKVIAKGLPEDFVRFAEGKFREVNEAYEAIQKNTA